VKALTQPASRASQAGFTLIEIMVVVVILGILASIVVPQVMDAPQEANIVKAHSDIQSLESALGRYKLNNFVYPSTEQGLDALVNKPSTSPIPKRYNKNGYVKRLQKDPWLNEYQYISPGEHSEIDIFSFGPDGVESEDDIGNWVQDDSSYNS